jgi:hypothetical protein
MGRDVIPDNTVLADVDAPIVRADANTLTNVDMKGKTLVVRYEPVPGAPTAGQPNQSAPNAPPALRNWARNILRTVTPQTPAAIVALVPDEFKDQWDRTAITFPRGTYGLDPDGTANQRVASRGVPLLYVKESALGGPLAADATLVASIFTDSFQYPSVNVIAKVPGRDPALASQYVLFSAHQDHDGERYAVNGDDIWNGADDNASTAVALLAIGRAVSAHRCDGRRLSSGTAEERGLMGSRVRQAPDHSARLDRCVSQRRSDRPE